MLHFNYDRVAEQAGISALRLRELCEVMRREFPADDMLYELHVLRACMAVRDGLVSLDDAIRPEPTPQPA